MNRKQLIIIVSVVALGVLLGTVYLYVSSRSSGSSFLGGLFPGESGARTTSTTAPSNIDTNILISPTFTPGSDAVPPRLYELHKVPVAGAGIIETKDKKGAIADIAVRYIERGLGYIFETPLSAYVESRIVNETRSNISEALWGNGGNSVVIRFIDDKAGGIIRTHILNISAPNVSFARNASSTIPSVNFLKTEEVFLPDYIPFMATSEDGANKLFYLERGVSASIGSVATFKDSGVSKVFSSSFTEWLPQFPNQNLVALTTKPSSSVPGYLYFVNTSSKSVSRILGGTNGLTTLTSHNGKLVLYSETKGGVPELYLYNVTKGTTQQLYLQTLPEKCVWGNKISTIIYCAVPQSLSSGTYPDQWYQGIVSFSDSVWEINATTFITKKILVPSDYKAPSLDIINPTLSSDDSTLVFMNKITLTPWVYRLIDSFPSQSSRQTATTSQTTPPPSVITPDMKKIN